MCFNLNVSIYVVPIVVIIGSKRMHTFDFCPGGVKLNNTQNNVNVEWKFYWVFKRSQISLNFKIEHSRVKNRQHLNRA